MKLLGQIPWLVISLILYHALVFSGVDVSKTLFDVGLPSGELWELSWNEILVIMSVIILYIELFKSTRTHVGSVVEHVFSLGVFLVFLLEFILVAKCGTSTFFILMMISLVDVVAGFTITISTARRDLAVPHTHA